MQLGTKLNWLDFQVNGQSQGHDEIKYGRKSLVQNAPFPADDSPLKTV